MTPVEWVALAWLVGTIAIIWGQYWFARRECRHQWHQGYRACRRDWELPPDPRPVAAPIWVADMAPAESHEEYEPEWSQPAEWDEASLSALAEPAAPLELPPAPGPVTIEMHKIMDKSAEEFASIRARFGLRQRMP